MFKIHVNAMVPSGMVEKMMKTVTVSILGKSSECGQLLQKPKKMNILDVINILSDLFQPLMDIKNHAGVSLIPLFLKFQIFVLKKKEIPEKPKAPSSNQTLNIPPPMPPNKPRSPKAINNEEDNEMINE